MHPVLRDMQRRMAGCARYVHMASACMATIRPTALHGDHRCVSTTTHQPTSASASASNDSGPLSGVRILDLTRILAGPYCSQVLSDYGADVIKVEEPGEGDGTRSWGPPFTPAGSSAYFLSVNRNKRSVGINIKAEAGREIVRRLAQRCDVLVENYIPGKMDELGLGYAALSTLNPRLIYASLSAYGTRGPLASAPGYDVMVAAQGGLLFLTGQDDQPTKPGVALTDIVTGLHLHGAIMAALLQRHRTGRGSHVRTSLYQAQLAALSMAMQNHLVDPAWQARRWGTAHSSIVPYQAFLCADGRWIVAGALSDSQWRAMQRLVQVGVGDARFDSNAGRVRHRGELITALTAVFASQPADHWLSALSAHKLPVAPVLSPAEALHSEQAAALGTRVTVEQAVDGAVEMVAPPVEMSEGEVRIRSGAPMLSQHTDEVLRQLCGAK